MHAAPHLKFLASQLAFLTSDREIRGNMRALRTYLLGLALLITLYAVLFHVIKLTVEGERYSWITGFYWTLVVMSTLGFGDIIFTSDIGRVFSMVVLMSGVFLLLVMLPFLFIRLFYAPWLEARVRLRAPRQVPEGTRGHVIVTEYDSIAAGLTDRLRAEGTPYFVIERDPPDGGTPDRRGRLGRSRRHRGRGSARERRTGNRRLATGNRGRGAILRTCDFFDTRFFLPPLWCLPMPHSRAPGLPPPARRRLRSTARRAVAAAACGSTI